MTPTPAPDTPSPAGRLERLASRCADSRIGRFMLRWRRFLPLVSFALGLGSYFLVQRQNALAQWLTVLMLVGWVALLFEGLLHRCFEAVLQPFKACHGLRLILQQWFER